jgi:uncharacterized membrane protein
MLPDEIPAHFGIGGDVTRFGSKYEMFITPVFALLMPLIFIALEWFTKKRDEQKAEANAKAMFWLGLLITGIFVAVTVWHLHMSFTGAENVNQANPDFMKILSAIISIGLILLGNILPKIKQNAIAGIRTAWTLNSESNWYKTHRFGGRLCFLGGILSTLLSLFVFDGFNGLIFLGITFAVITVVIVVYSYRLSISEKG